MARWRSDCCARWKRPPARPESKRYGFICTFMLVIEHQRSHDDGEKKEELFSRERKRENALPGKRPGRPGSSGGLAALSDA